MAPPQTVLTNPQVEFIETRLSRNFHPAFHAPGVQYDRVQGKFVSQTDSSDCAPPPTKLPSLSAIYASAAAAKRDFLTKVLKRPIVNEEPQAVVTLESWKDVLDLVDTAVDTYCKPGRVRNGMRKLGDHAPSIQAWMGLFPSTSYSSTLCAGVKMVLEVAATMKKLREQVLEMLSEIPEYLAKTDLYLDLHKDVDSERIHRESAKLYVALLDAVKLMVEWLNQKSVQKLGKCLIRGAVDYGKKIQDQLANIEKIAKCVAEEAAICCQQKTNQVYASITDQTVLMKTMGAEVDLKLNNIDFGVQRSLDVINAMHTYLTAFPGGPGDEKPLRLIAARKTFSREVIEFLEFSAEGVSKDLRTCFREGQAANVVTKDRVHMALKSPEFLTWLNSSTSATLLINGQSEVTFISPMSHLCAFLAEALNSVERRVPHSVYFCGLRGRTKSVGAADLVKSLIGQLMLRFEFDFSFLRGKKPKKLNQPKQLCLLLRSLLGQLPENTVLFWIVDGVSWFQSSDRLEVTRIVFAELIQLVRECKDVVIKLLFTSPNISREVGLLCKGEAVLNVPRFVDGERQGTLDTTLMDAMGRIGSQGND